MLAAADLAAVGEPELPVLDVEDVAAQLADLAAAALQAALAVAVAETEADPDGPARRDRDGQDRRPRAELRERRRRRVRRRARRPADHPAGQPGHAHRRGGVLPGRRQPPPGGPAGRARPHARRAPVLLQAVGQDLGVPGAAQGPAGGGRPGAGCRLRRGRRAAGVERRRDATTSWPTSRRCAAGWRSTSAPTTPTARSSSGRAGCATSSSRCSSSSSCTGAPTSRCARRPRWRRSPRSPTAATWGVRTAPTWPRPTGSCACWSTGSSCSGCGAPTCSPPPTTPTTCAGSPGRRGCGPTGAATSSACWPRSGRTTRAACAGCTRSSSTGRCSRPCRGCPSTRCGCRSRRRSRGWARWAGRRRRAHSATCGR